MAIDWPANWRRVRLEEVADVKWGDTSVTKASYVPSGYIAYSASGPDGYLPYADFDKTGVVLSAIGADCGKTWLARGKWSCIKNTIRFFSICDEVDTEFLYWVTRRSDIWPKRGSAQPFISQGDARGLEIAYPSIDVQHLISQLLGALDDKIELNQRMSETLDQISQAAYEAWFQTFRPEMDLPHGWRRAPLSEFFDLGIGGVWGEGSRTAKSTISAHSLRGIDCHNLAEVQLPDVPVRWISERQLKSRNIPAGTILIEGSGSFCGRSLVWTESYNRLFEQPVVYSNFVKRLSPKVDSAQAIVAAFGLREAYRKGVVQAYRTGTAFPNLDVKGLLASLEVVVPTAEVAQRFVEIYSPERRVLTLLENNTLRQLRDTLLPKLLAGEIHVVEAEQLVSDVA